MNENGKREDSPNRTIRILLKHPNNGFSYLIHQTKDAQNKYQYPISEVISNFDFAKKLGKHSKTSRGKQSKKKGNYYERISRYAL